MADEWLTPIADEPNVSRLDRGVPHIARVYDYCLGGKDNFAADREAAEEFVKVMPGIIPTVRECRKFLARAVSFRRLSRLTDEVFGLTISEGASANILVRTEAPLLAATTPIAAAVRTSPVVGSDQTSARVRGKTWWQGMLLITNAIHHVIGDTGAASVVATFLDGAQPEKWVADRYGGQLGHGAVRQMCLAHCYVTRSMRSKPATPCSRRSFDGCCCALWPSADDARH